MLVVGQRVAYIRVSSQTQNSARQHETLGQCDAVFEDRQSGRSADRPELQRMIEYVREGDEVLVASLDRLARSLPDLLALVKHITDRNVRLHFVKENLTFTGDDDPMSTLLLSMLGAVAAFEVSLIRERQAQGIALAKEAGKYQGRRPALTADQIEAARQQVEQGVSKARVARDLGCSRATLYAALSGAGTYAGQDTAA